MKTLFVIVLITFGLMVGCASREQIDQQNELVREHQTPEDRADRQQQIQIERQLQTNPEPWR
jgi:uncharacterized protein YcfL